MAVTTAVWASGATGTGWTNLTNAYGPNNGTVASWTSSTRSGSSSITLSFSDLASLVPQGATINSITASVYNYTSNPTSRFASIVGAFMSGTTVLNSKNYVISDVNVEEDHVWAGITAAQLSNLTYRVTATRTNVTQSTTFYVDAASIEIDYSVPTPPVVQQISPSDGEVGVSLTPSLSVSGSDVDGNNWFCDLRINTVTTSHTSDRTGGRTFFVDGDDIYIGFGAADGLIRKYISGDFNNYVENTAPSGVSNVLSLSGDSSYLYAGYYKSPGVICKISKDTMSTVSTTPLDSGYNNVGVVVADGDYLWAGLESGPVVVKMLTSDLSVVSYITIEPASSGRVCDLAVDQSYLYIGVDDPSTGKIYRVNKASGEVGSANVESGRGFPSVLVDNDYVYFGSTDWPARLYRTPRAGYGSSYEFVSLPEGHNISLKLFGDNTHVYTTLYTMDRIARVDKREWANSSVESLLAPNSGSMQSVGISNTKAYSVTWSPTMIYGFGKEVHRASSGNDPGFSSAGPHASGSTVTYNVPSGVLDWGTEYEWSARGVES